MPYDYNFKIVLLGEIGTGKMSLTKKFLYQLFNPHSKQTIGVDFEVKRLEIDGKSVKLQIWIYEKRFRSIAPYYFHSAEGILCLYDVTNRASLAYIDKLLPIIRKRISDTEDCAILFVGNKTDLDDKRQISSEEGIQFAKSKGVNGFIECSAKTGDNVEEIFDMLAKLMIDNRERNK